MRLRGLMLAGESADVVRGRLAAYDVAPTGCVLLIEDIKDLSYTVALASSAVVCFAGTRTGHVSSVCRARGIPVLKLRRSSYSELKAVLGMTVEIEPGKSTISHVVSRPELRTRVGPETAELPAAPLEVVIAGAHDIDRVNATAMGGFVNSFFMREEFLWHALGQHPLAAIQDSEASMLAWLVEQVRDLANRLHGDQQLCFRVLDLRSDDGRSLWKQGRHGAEWAPPREANPELGLHGARWLLAHGRYLRFLRQVLRETTSEKVRFFAPFVNDAQELSAVLHGLDAKAENLGVFVETPASVICLRSMLASGVKEVRIGTKDLAQLTLGADRGSHLVAGSYNTSHPAVLALIQQALAAAQEAAANLRIYVLARDLQAYQDEFGIGTSFMLCAGEVVQLKSPTT